MAQTCGQISECDDKSGGLDHLDLKDHSRLSVAGRDGLPDAPQKLENRIIHDPVFSGNGRPTQMRHHLHHQTRDNPAFAWLLRVETDMPRALCAA